MAASRASLEVQIRGDSSGAQRAARETASSFQALEGSAKSFSSAWQNALSGKLGSAVSDAKKGLSGLGQAAGGTGTLIGVGIAAGAVTAGAALGKFAFDGVAKFEDLALSVSRFSKATGLSTVEASKFIEVAKDLKIDPATFEGAFVKMEKGIATNRKAFGDLVVTAKDGTVNLTATFLNVVRHLQSIRDPIERANESAKLFGRGFAGISEIIGTSADEISKRLEDVGKQAGKIITPEEVAQAQKYRDALDQFHDTVENLQIELGQKLVPSLTAAAQGATQFIDIFLKAGEIVAKGFSVQNTKTQVQETNNLSRAWKQFAGGDWWNLIKETFTGVPKDVQAAAAATDALGTSVASTAADFRAADQATGSFATSADSVTGVTGASAASFRLWDEFIKGSTTSVDALGHANDRYADSAAGMAAQARTAAAALQAENDKILAQQSAIDGLLGATTSVDRAQQDFIDKSKAVAEAQLAAAKGGKDHADKLRTLRLAIDDAKDSAQALGQANIAQAREQAKATGKTLTAQQENHILADTYRALAGTQKGPVADALRGTAFLLDAVGRKKPTPVVKVADYTAAPITTITRRITALNGKTAVVVVRANTSSAQQSVDAFIQANSGRGFTTVQTIQHAGTVVRQATGGVSKGGLTLVGEMGPELVSMPRGAHVSTAAETRQMLGGGGVTYNINVAVPIAADMGRVGADVVTAIKAYEKRAGSGWRN